MIDHTTNTVRVDSTRLRPAARGRQTRGVAPPSPPSAGSNSPTEPTPAGPHLRLFAPSVEPGEVFCDRQETGSRRNFSERADGLSPRMTLSEFFQQWFVPCHLMAGGAAARNVDQYRESMGLWVGITDDPPLHRIDRAVAAEFMTTLATRRNKRGEPISPNTVRKHRTHIQAILDLAGPADGVKRGRETATPDGLFGGERAPFMRPPKPQESVPDGGWKLREIAAWMEAASHATLPRLPGVDPGVFWPALILLTYNTCLRIGTVMALRREWIDAEGFLTVPARAMKGGRREHKIWLNGPARVAVRRLTTADAHVVPWPFRDSDGGGRQHRGRYVRRQLEEAGISDARVAAVQKGKPLHGLRAACERWLWSRDPRLAKQVAGQVSGDVALENYVPPATMRRWLEKLPQPVGWERLVRDDAGQMTFDF